MVIFAPIVEDAAFNHLDPIETDAFSQVGGECQITLDDLAISPHLICVV